MEIVRIPKFFSYALAVACAGTIALFVIKWPSDDIQDSNELKLNLRPQKNHPVTDDMMKVANGMVSNQAANQTLETPFGIEVELRSLWKDRPLLIFFIEKECPCCLNAKLFVDSASQYYRGKLNVVGIINGNSDQAKAWRTKVKPDFTILCDPDCTAIKAFKADRGVYTTLVAPGGTIDKSYPGYSKTMLQELSYRIADLTHSERKLLRLDAAPDQLTSGCQFEIPTQTGKS